MQISPERILLASGVSTLGGLAFAGVIFGANRFVFGIDDRVAATIAALAGVVFSLSSADNLVIRLARGG